MVCCWEGRSPANSANRPSSRMFLSVELGLSSMLQLHPQLASLRPTLSKACCTRRASSCSDRSLWMSISGSYSMSSRATTASVAAPNTSAHFSRCALAALHTARRSARSLRHCSTAVVQRCSSCASLACTLRCGVNSTSLLGGGSIAASAAGALEAASTENSGRSGRRQRESGKQRAAAAIPCQARPQLANDHNKRSTHPGRRTGCWPSHGTPASVVGFAVGLQQCHDNRCRATRSPQDRVMSPGLCSRGLFLPANGAEP
jgi:hypothetical protein